MGINSLNFFSPISVSFQALQNFYSLPSNGILDNTHSISFSVSYQNLRSPFLSLPAGPVTGQTSGLGDTKVSGDSTLFFSFPPGPAVSLGGRGLERDRLLFHCLPFLL